MLLKKIIKEALEFLIKKMAKLKCCVCDKEIDEFDEDAIVGVPFGEETVNYCNIKCMDKLRI